MTELPPHLHRLAELSQSDPQLRALMPDPAVDAAARAEGNSYQQQIAAVLDGYAERTALGRRAYEIGTDTAGRTTRQLLDRFDTITYRELHDRIKTLAAVWQGEQYHVAPGEFVCVLGFTGIDFVTVDLACVYTQAVGVPLQTSLANADISGIFSDTEPAVVAATITDLVQAARLATQHSTIRTVIAFDYDERVDAEREAYETAAQVLADGGSAAKLVTLDALLASSDPAAWTPPGPSPDGDERMALLVHSSGSTGTPKGVIIPDRVARWQWSGGGSGPLPVLRLIFLPMNHQGGRSMVYMTLSKGGTAYFTANADLSTLIEDVRLVRPTEIMFFPRVIEMIHRHFLAEVLKREDVDRETAEQQVMAEMRAGYLGDRLCSIAVSTAPATPELRRFISECFQLPLGEGYGSTETGTMTGGNRIVRPPVLDYKVTDVPELGYYSTDRPYPRGELRVKTMLATPGYFKRPEATANLFDEDGFIRTGDIVEERGPDHVVLIDRRNDVTKLAQGEFVALGQLGQTFESGSDVISQAYVYGSGARAFVLAVIVPDPNVVRKQLGADASDAAIKELIRGELKRIAAESDLRSFEVPRDFIVEHEAFTHENGLLSSVHKRLRPALLARYGARLEEIYEALEQRQQDELAALSDLSNGMSVLERIGKALEASLGVEDIDVNAPIGFVDLGGDSLGASTFAELLRDIFGVTLPVSAILSPAGNPVKWARAIEALLSDQRGLATVESIHGEDLSVLRAEDLHVSRFFDAAALSPAPAAAETRTVLLTGGTGYLGRFLALAWLEQLAPVGGRVIALVRGTDEADARRRLTAAFAGPDEELQTRFDKLAAEHLEIVVGDVAEPNLGLSAEDFDRLARDVDRICHPAALVNHVLPYADLFGPNVAGTAELVRLALTQRIKPLDFVSSLAATLLLDKDGTADEDTPLLPTAPSLFGYGASKWAAEQMLHSANRDFGLPVNVFRGDMMLAHSSYVGQINTADVFTRLLSSVVITGLAPKSFYPLEADGTPAREHYDGLPVDFVAASIVGLGASPAEGVRNFHVVNHHDDGINLDTFVQWIIEAGYPVEIVEPYEQWVSRFEAKLSALPEAVKAHTSLAVIGQLRTPRRSDGMVGSQRFQEGVRTLPIGPDVPHLDRAFIDKNLADMRAHGLIPPVA